MVFTFVNEEVRLLALPSIVHRVRETEMPIVVMPGLDLCNSVLSPVKYGSIRIT